MSNILVIHGGAGTWERGRLNRAIRELEDIAKESFNILKKEGSLAAVENAIRRMEMSDTFNAGKGAALNLFGEVELDAGLMLGDGTAGAVAGVRNVFHPITLAKIVLLETDHILLIREGAEYLAELRGLATDPKNLISDNARKRWLKAVKEILEIIEGKPVRSKIIDRIVSIYPRIFSFLKNNKELLTDLRRRIFDVGDTVGAVAFNGRVLVAGTSTGGLFLKLPGRVGDTPIIGAGFYALNDYGACSATGVGEDIMRELLCKKAVEYAREYGAYEGAKRVFRDIDQNKKLRAGIILIDSKGAWGIYHKTDHFPCAVINEKDFLVKEKWI